MFVSACSPVLAAARSSGRLHLSRTVSSTAGCRSSKDAPTTTSATSGPSSQDRMRNQQTSLSKGQKMYLMFSGKYRSMAEIPDEMSNITANAELTKARIGLNMVIAAITVVVMAGAIFWGKRRARQGEFIEGRMIEWHQEIRDGAKAEK